MSDDPGVELLFRIVAVLGGGVLLAVFLVGLALWSAGQVSGVLSGHGWPDSGPGDSAAILRAVILERRGVASAWPAGARPDLGPDWLTLAIFVVFLAVLACLVVMVVRLSLTLRRRRRRVGPLFRLGFASSFEVYRLLGKRSVLVKAERLRPSLVGRRVQPEDVGFQIGIDRRSRRGIYGSCEDSLLVVGPPRRGRDVLLRTGLTIDAPGACIVFTPRLDLFTSTYQSRARKGKVYVLDPLNFTRWPERLRWSPSRGCANPVGAHIRARRFIMWQMSGGGGSIAMAQGGATDLVTGAVTVLQCYLRAADLGGRTTRDIMRWMREPLSPEPVEILRAAEDAGKGPLGWSTDLEAVTINADPRFMNGVLGIVKRAFSSLEDGPTLDACSPAPKEAFNLQEFVEGQNTMYILAKDDAGCRALVLTLFIDMVNQARDYASIQPASRLDPPLTMVLDEASVPLPIMNLPSLISDLGGLNITLHVYLSSLSDGRRLWGSDGMAAIWDNATVRVVTGGGGNAADLAALSGLMGSVKGKPVLTADEIRTMKHDRAVLVAGSSRPVEVKLMPWWKREDGQEIARSVKETEAQIRRHLDDARKLESSQNAIS